MEKNRIIIVLLVIIIVLLAAILLMIPNMNNQNSKVETNTTTIVNETTSAPVTPDTITVELPEFDKTYIGTAGEYKVEASKWMGGSVGGFEVHLYKNDQQVYRDSYLSRAYFYMDGEWKWSDWGNGESGYEAYHRYPVSNGVEIQKVEVKF